MRSTTDELDWPEGWEPVGERAAAIERELRREMSWRHPLRWQRIRVIAHRPGSDDVLVEIVGDPPRYAEVHLTWRREWWSAEWPWTVFFESVTSWRTHTSGARG